MLFYQDLYLCSFSWFSRCLSLPEALVAVFSRKSFWQSWRTWNRRRWTKTCWRSEDRRMSPSPMCLQLHYLPNLVRAFYKTDTVIQRAVLQNPFFKLKEESIFMGSIDVCFQAESEMRRFCCLTWVTGNHNCTNSFPSLTHLYSVFFFLFSLLKAKKEEDDEDMEDLQRWAMEAMWTPHQLHHTCIREGKGRSIWGTNGLIGCCVCVFLCVWGELTVNFM